MLALHFRGTVTDEPALLLAKFPCESSHRLEINRQKSAKSIAFSRRGTCIKYLALRRETSNAERSALNVSRCNSVTM